MAEQREGVPAGVDANVQDSVTRHTEKLRVLALLDGPVNHILVPAHTDRGLEPKVNE